MSCCCCVILLLLHFLLPKFCCGARAWQLRPTCSNGTALNIGMHHSGNIGMHHSKHERI